MKKLMTLFLSCLLVAGACLSASAAANVDIQIGGKAVEFSAAPFIDENDRTLVPAGELFAALGISAETTGATVTAKTEDGASVALTAGSLEAVVNGETTVALDSPAVLSDGVLFVPLRFVCEALSYRVAFYGLSASRPDRNLVTVSSGAQSITIAVPGALYETDSRGLLSVAAAIVGLDEISCVLLDNASQDALINAFATAAVIMDNGAITDEQKTVFAAAGSFLPLDDALAAFAPDTLAWIESDEALRQSVTDLEGNIIAFPVNHNGTVERFFVSAQAADPNGAVSLIHGYNEVIKGLTASAE